MNVSRDSRSGTGFLKGKEDLNCPCLMEISLDHGGEQEQVQARMAATILQLMQETDGQSVLMVSHGGVMANFARAIKNWRLDDPGHDQLWYLEVYF